MCPLHGDLDVVLTGMPTVKWMDQKEVILIHFKTELRQYINHMHACTAFYKQVAPSDNEEAENSVDVVLKQRAALLTQIHDKASGKQTSR